ncbi:MAG: NAD-dependent DNA ligase LigA [Candidatus Magasanikbacteria bacterium]|nr:NAD-dependent DNA ligase LigA [Candidatus Magasanikbacteria bacterium]
MDKTEIKENVKRLRNQIDDLRHRYHVLNDPEVTDKMYDGLMDELRKIEEKYPELKTSDSPTQRVAGEVLEKFEKVEHTVPQWSFNDAFTQEDIEKWEERIEKMIAKKMGKKVKLDYTAELKIDGLHLVLTYKKGVLEVAATRGNGKVGENVMQNIKTIHSIPLKLKEEIDLVVEGEIWMGRDIFEKINKEREKNGEVKFANPRNAAAGTIRQLDSKIVAKRKLSFTAYDISAGDIPETQELELKRLKDLGFPTDKSWEKVANVTEILKFHKNWEKRKNSKQYWVDGVVLKVNKKEYQDKLGYTGKAPRWAIAFKFPAEQGTTKVIDIFVQVGRTGKLTPVALMEPVQLAGSTVTHATLHNFDEIARLDVRVGDTVVVQKAGDIIPQIVKVLEKMRTGKEKKIVEPKKCPICDADVKHKNVQDKKQEKSVGLYCENKNCYGQQLEKIRHFVSKKGMDIDGLGEKIVEQLLNKGLIKDISDLFILQKDELLGLDGFAEKSVINLLNSIEQSKNNLLYRFVFALGIPHVGEETAIKLASHFGSFKNIQSANEEELIKISDIGGKVVESIGNYFADEQNREIIKKMFENGVKLSVIKITKKGKITDKTFVFTGGMQEMTRDEAKEKVRNSGGIISGSVSKKVDFIVAGSDAGSKLKKAEKIGVKILSEKEFIDLLST